MNKGVLAHIRPDRPHERISIPECLSAAPSTDISSAVYDRLTVSLPLYAADRFSPSALIPGVATEIAEKITARALAALPEFRRASCRAMFGMTTVAICVIRIKLTN